MICRSHIINLFNLKISRTNKKHNSYWQFYWIKSTLNKQTHFILFSFTSKQKSNFIYFQLSTDVQVLHHVLELRVRDLPVIILNYNQFTKSAFIIVLSTSCCNCKSVKLLPTIIFNTVNNSPFVMYPSSSISYILNANSIFFYSSEPYNAAKPEIIA